MVSLGRGQMKVLFSRKLLVNIYQCWNYSMNKNCFTCMTPSNPKFDKRLWNKSFSQRRIKKSDSTVLVPGKNIATTPQYSIRFGNQAPSKDQPSLNLNCWKTNQCRPSTLAHICEHGLGLCAHWQWDRSELMSNNVIIRKHVVESFGWSQL